MTNTKVRYWVINAHPCILESHGSGIHAYLSSLLELTVHVVRVEQLPLCTTQTANDFNKGK